MKNMYLFAYGSLMNPRSRAKTLSGARTTRPAHLGGYRRKMNIVFDEYAYANIVPDAQASVQGVCISIDEDELARFAQREAGYTLVDVTSQIAHTGETVVAFVAPDIPCTHKVPRSYITTCTAGMSETERNMWIQESELAGIEEDAKSPLYEFNAE